MSSRAPPRAPPSRPRLGGANRPCFNGYEVISGIGAGAFGKVSKVLRKKDGQQFEMKVVPRSKLGDEKSWDRFQREVDVLHGLRHPNIVQLQDFFTQNDSFYLIMDLCMDGDLLNYIIKNDKLNEPVAALLFEQIVSALAYCHANGVAHRDLKPENIFIAKFPVIKVGDFGLCNFQEEGELLSTFCGSPSYTSPECLSRIEYDGAKSDRWSLGVILYAMVTGRHPWDLSNHSVMASQILAASFAIPSFVSADCADIIRGLMQLNPDARTPLDQLLQHPWFKLGSQARVLNRPGATPLAKLAGSSGVLVRRRGSVPNVIVSPFQDEEPKDEEAPEEVLHVPTRRLTNPTLMLDKLQGVTTGRRASVSVTVPRQRSLLPDLVESQVLGKK
jgi:serine/threonine protein kinase